MVTRVSLVKRVLVGRPLASESERGTRLPKLLALPVFAADALASTAFASQEILAVLWPVAGVASIGYLVPISLVVVALLVVVVTSYFQTLHAYPNGGGSYIVSRENLGQGVGLVAAASLMVDYILTVSVSIAAGVAAITSAVGPLRSHVVGVGLVLIVLIMLANLRGAKESGALFAGPTYAYILLMSFTVLWGILQSSLGHVHPIAPTGPQNAALAGVTLFLLMRAFSSGAVALSGVEAISNGIQAFRKPEPRNAAITLIWAAVILGGLFFGIAVLIARLHPVYSEQETILSQMARVLYGRGVMYIAVQASTAAILVLSANTAFADFPRLSGIVAADGYLPRQLASRGDRLVLSNGIIALALVAGGLYAAFGGQTTALIPLFAVGLFMSFTLSQAGMVVHHRRLRAPGWRPKLVVNAVGSAATAVVTLVVLVSKFTEGAWIPTALIPVIVFGFVMINRHYRRVADTTAVSTDERIPTVRIAALVLIGPSVNRGVLKALGFASAMNADLIQAIHVAFDQDDAAALQRQWADHRIDVPLDIIDSPYRELSGPIIDYIDRLDALDPNDTLTIILPEFVVHGWWQQLLHNQSALWLKVHLLFRPNTVVISIPIPVA
jgi:amino acid transporter